MLPGEKALVERQKGRPFALLGINSDGEREVVKKKLAAEGIGWRQAIDGSTGGPLSKAWDVHAWPTIYLLGEEGKIRSIGLRGAALDEAVEKLVAELEAKSKPSEPAKPEK